MTGGEENAAVGVVAPENDATVYARGAVGLAREWIKAPQFRAGGGVQGE